MFSEIVPKVVEGERPSAGKWNRLADLVDRNQSQPSSHWDPTGIYVAPEAVGGFVWGKLDEDLAHDSTVGATVSIWRGVPSEDSERNISNVFAPAWLAAGSVYAGQWVLVGRIDGRRQIVSVAPVTHLGKLDAALTYNDTTGVSVSVWSGNPLADSTRNITGVLPPPFLTSGQLDSGDWVKIEWIGGHWYVTGTACE